MSLLRSFGLKRYVASVLTAVAGILSASPEAAFLIPVVTQIAALFGLTGLVHAGKEGTLATDYHGLSLVSLFSILVYAAHTVPQLQAYEHILRLIASFLGVTTVALSELPADITKSLPKKKK